MRRPLAALLFAMMFPTLMAYLEFMVFVHDPSTANSMGRAFALGKVVQFSFPLLLVLALPPRTWPFARPTLRGAGLGIGFGLLVALGIGGLYVGFLRDADLFADAKAKIETLLESFGMPGLGGMLLVGGFVALIHSFLEEYYWRWFVFLGWKQYLPWSLAVLVSALGFMSHHVIVLGYYFPGYFWTAAVPFSLGVAVGGMAWAWLYDRAGSLVAPWLSHAIVDLAIMGIGWDLLTRQAPG